MHRWRQSHYAADGTVTRVCAHCLVRRIERPGAPVAYRLLSRVELGHEPACVALLNHATAMEAA